MRMCPLGAVGLGSVYFLYRESGVCSGHSGFKSHSFPPQWLKKDFKLKSDLHVVKRQHLFCLRPEVLDPRLSLHVPLICLALQLLWWIRW